MDKVRIPDPLEVEVEALDNAFYDWLENNEPEDSEYLIERWQNATHEPITYTMDEIHEGWGNDIEDFWETNNLVVDKMLYEEAQRKRQILNEINGDEDGA